MNALILLAMFIQDPTLNCKAEEVKLQECVSYWRNQKKDECQPYRNWIKKFCKEK